MEAPVITDIAAIGRIDAIPFILKLCCQNTGLRFAAVARVTNTAWTACAVRDEINFGLEAGDELDLKTTICDEIRESGTGVIIDHVAHDPLFQNHHTPRQYGFQSYISIPIVLEDGEFFGTLCALDPEPAKLSRSETVSMFEGFAQLIALQLEAQDRLSASEAALEQADRAAQYTEQFIAILAHDLRNPLASIQAGVRMLARTDLPPREDSIVHHMLESCGRMGGLITDVLDFARGRLGGGVPIVVKGESNLAAALHQVIEELRIVYPGREILSSIALREAVACDVPRVMQLLSNLVGNALAHGDCAKPVTVEARTNDSILTIEVVNGGEPIAPDRIATIFQPFKHRSDKDAHEGLGLGLYIAGEIAAAHGGNIEVSSTTKQTSFRLTMPCAAAPA